MLTRTGAVSVDGLGHKSVVDSFRFIPLGLIVRIKQHQHMKITIAYVAHDCAWKACLSQLLRGQFNAFG